MHYTTLNKIRYFSPSKHDWETLLSSLGKTKPDDEPLSMKAILDSNGIDDALWCIRALDKQTSVDFAIFCAEKVLPVFEKTYPNDDRPRKAIEEAKKFNVPDASAAARAAYAAAARAAARAAADPDDYDVYDASDYAADYAADAAGHCERVITKKSLFEAYFCTK